MVEDIDDLSDTDKVSLISDIDIPTDTPQQSQKPSSNLNLMDISKITSGGQVKKVHTGIEISRQKYLCSRKKSCTSCYALPEDSAEVNVAD